MKHISGKVMLDLMMGKSLTTDRRTNQ